MRCFLLFLFSFCFTITLSAQGDDYAFSKLDIYNGLSHNQVNSFLRDQKGFLWIGTMSGLNRYDGYTTKIFRHKPGDSTSLIDNYISYLFELPFGKMWVMTRNEPCIYDSQTEKFSNAAGYLQSMGLPNDSLLTITKGRDNRYWFLFNKAGLYSYAASGKKVAAFLPYAAASSHVAANKITSLKEDRQGHLWLVYQDGLIEKRESLSGAVLYSSKVLQQKNGGRYEYRLFVDKDGDLWLWAANTPNGLCLFSPRTNTTRQFNETNSPTRLNANLITDVNQDRQGLVWVATDHGGINLVDKMRGYQTQFLTNDPKDPRSLGQNSITALYKDENGIIWVGTYKQGVNYLNENTVKFAHYHHREMAPQSLQYDDVNRFVEDKRGNLWIGTNGGGLIYFDRAANTFREYLHNPANPNSISNNVIVSLCLDRTGRLWIGSYFGGLSSFDGKTFTHYRHDDNNATSLSDDRVWEVFEDREANLWVGTLNGGLDLLDRKTGRFEHYQYWADKQSPLLSNYISAILQDRKGNLWIGTAIGITVFEKGSITPVHYQHTKTKASLSNDNVISLLEDSRGRIWVGTREGLNLFDEKTKTFEAYTTADGLPDNAILNILEDNRHTLWISTTNGLCNLSPKTDLGRLTFSIISYDESNNLQGREFNENAALKTRAGELIFGGPGGFNVIQPEKIGNRVTTPQIVFTSLQVANQEVEVGEEINGRILLAQALPESNSINLKYRENVFSLEFASLDFAHGSRGKYAYRLRGFNSDWLYTDGTQHRVTYTNLDPGDYVFEIKALKSDGAWSNVKSLAIHITPPLWRTPLVYILYGLFILALLYFWRRFTLERAHMRFEMRQQRREAERVQELDQLKTKFFTNVSHEFRTPLSLIITPLDKIIKQASDPEQRKQLHLVHQNAKRLLSLVNQLLDFRKMEVQAIKLHPAVGDIVRFANDITYSFSDIAEKKVIRLQFSSNVGELEIYFDKDKIEKILFNLISNAFKYTPDGGAVDVGMVYAPPGNDEAHGRLTIFVKDTGIGIPADKQERIFERFFQNEVPDNMVNQGTGIGLAITREFVKLHNGTIVVESAPEKGTCFMVSIPAVKIHETSTVLQPAQPQVNGDLPKSEEPASDKGRKRTILVVEDNEDLRFYLKDNLKVQYQVEEASTGKEGWDKARTLLPDLVVSDIMMSVMDGIELARKIKTDTLTAHIPVILLTAMGSEEKQVEGFSIGVNDYITKPFTFEILASRIRNLLAQQTLLQKKFQKQIEVNPSEITVTSLDEQFLKQALTVVEKNLDNPDFSVEDLSREMFLSRVAFYKKILSLTGKAPLEFIRSIRMKRAAQLLEKSGKTVAEIAYEVGFNNPKNFSRYFKEEFSLLPSQYQAEKKAAAST
jgi:signal transduction histidine kinase/ligand-binding sensor domain-containing protein/DNA-binding response OmpR family regulator